MSTKRFKTLADLAEKMQKENEALKAENVKLKEEKENVIEVLDVAINKIHTAKDICLRNFWGHFNINAVVDALSGND